MNLYSNSKETFLTYVSRLPLNKLVKELICDEKFISSNPDFYLYYSKLFSKPFKISKKKIELISIAGYFYYQSVLFLDRLIDDGDKSNIALISICQEEAIKILTSLFGANSSFWEVWNKRKEEYFHAINLEKKLQNSKDVSFDQYIILSDFKSAYGKIAIESLAIIDSNFKTSNLSNVLDSHKYFSVAYQLNDDILDFEIDIQNSQFNWLVYKYVKLKDNKKTTSHLKKELYLEGKITETFELAISYINKAEECVYYIDLPLWKNVLNKIKLKFLNSKREINQYIKLLHNDMNLSQIKQKNYLDKSILLAIEYIKNKQCKNGSWEDYVNQAGISNIWATAFIVSKISFTKKMHYCFKSQINKSLKFLKSTKINNGLWGYNDTWIEDVDTSNFVLLSYFLNNLIDNECDLFDKWIKYKNEDNLFRTYIDSEFLIKSLSDKNINNVDGWTSAHLCVSSVTFYVSILIDEKNIQSCLRKAFQKISFEDINAYWWTDRIYTLYYLALCYFELKDERLFEIQENVSKKITERGYLDCNGVNLFYTALALEILLLNSEIYMKQIDKCVTFILNNQYTDGSWDGSNCLFIPDPTKTPTLNKTFTNPISTHGVNVRAKEFNRLFTTVSILKSLSLWSEIN